jgi:hypothetical protein
MEEKMYKEILESRNEFLLRRKELRETPGYWRKPWLWKEVSEMNFNLRVLDKILNSLKEQERRKKNA